MRLIDADALSQTFIDGVNRAKRDQYQVKDWLYNDTPYINMGAVLATIDRAPTVEPKLQSDEFLPCEHGGPCEVCRHYNTNFEHGRCMK